MVNEQITNYIETVTAQGYSESTIREVLAKNGWQTPDVDAAFSYIKLKSNTLSSAAPMAPGMVAQAAHDDVSKEKILSQIYDKPANPVVEYNSPFSAGLAVVLLVDIGSYNISS